MSLTTKGTADPTDPEAETAVRNFDVSVIVGMNRQASSLAAGTSELMELEA